ncbi:hypothetical protein GGR50DRAFT_698103 [Xylaria sp. CBS 124048]|nr:hypothetical protein GGR50DRAFT_698103 [Xylaria sp. CBS 124048]
MDNNNDGTKEAAYRTADGATAAQPAPVDAPAPAVIDEHTGPQSASTHTTEPETGPMQTATNQTAGGTQSAATQPVATQSAATHTADGDVAGVQVYRVRTVSSSAHTISTQTTGTQGSASRSRVNMAVRGSNIRAINQGQGSFDPRINIGPGRRAHETFEGLLGETVGETGTPRGTLGNRLARFDRIVDAQYVGAPHPAPRPAQPYVRNAHTVSNDGRRGSPHAGTRENIRDCCDGCLNCCVSIIYRWCCGIKNDD